MRMVKKEKAHSSDAKGLSHNLGSIDVVALRPVVTGIFITLSCRNCGNQFESYQPTVAGLGFGQHVCPGCQTVYEFGPEDLQSALDMFFPHCKLDEMLQIKKEGSRIARAWHQDGHLADLLNYKGINLGQPTERVLLSFILTGLFRAHKLKQEKQ